MPQQHDLLYKLALKKIPKVGSVTAKNLISYTGGIEAVFREKKSRLLKIPGVGQQLATNIGDKGILIDAERELHLIEKHQITVRFYLDPEYPRRLRQFPHCPILLYTRGAGDLNAERMVAIVGTRKASSYGKKMAEKIVQSMAPYGTTVVSGLAYGVDITAHRAAIRAGLPTVGVMGSGQGRIYPQQHKSTAQQMMDTGALITECDFLTGPDRENFPARNRIIAGMVDAVVVVESAERGGSIITADFANYYNKDVFAVPGRAGDHYSVGTNELIKNHKAHLITDGQDIAQLLRWEESKSTQAQRQIFAELSEAEKLVTELFVENEEKHVDRLALESKMPMSALSTILLSLEFKGIVKSLPGKRYLIV